MTPHERRAYEALKPFRSFLHRDRQKVIEAVGALLEEAERSECEECKIHVQTIANLKGERDAWERGHRTAMAQFSSQQTLTEQVGAFLRKHHEWQTRHNSAEYNESELQEKTILTLAAIRARGQDQAEAAE